MAKNAGAAGCIGIDRTMGRVNHLSLADVTIAQLDQIRIVTN